MLKCDMLCNSVRAAFCGCTVHTSRRLARGFFSKQPKPVLTLRKKIHQSPKNVENSKSSSSTGFGPTLTMMTKLFAGWPGTVCRTCNLFSGQLRSRILHCPQFCCPSSFCICRKNPMFRILNSFSSCSGVDVLLQGDPVVQYFVEFFPHHG